MNASAKRPLKLSVITPTRNVAETIQCCVRSVQVQQGVDVEHVVVDGGSTDGTIERALECASPALKVVSQRSKGLYAAINEGIAAASGDAFGILGGDDFYTSEHALRGVAESLERHSVSYADLVYVSRGDPLRPVRYWRSGRPSPAQIAMGWMPPHPTLFVKRAAHEAAGAYREDMRIAADYDYCLRLFSNPSVSRESVAYEAQARTVMRLGGTSNGSFEQILAKSREDMRASWSQYSVWAPFLVLCKNLRKIGQFRTGQLQPVDTEYFRAISPSRSSGDA